MSSKFSISKKKKFIISEEVALEQVLQACEAYDIDVDSEPNEEKRSGTETMLNDILDFVRRGYIEINDDNTITQNLQNQTGDSIDIKYRELTGKQKLEADGKGHNHRMAMVYAILGAASGIGEAGIKKLKGIDLKVAERITIFFS